MEKLESNLNPSSLFHRYVWGTCFRSHGRSKLELKLELACRLKLLKGSLTKCHLPCHRHLSQYSTKRKHRSSIKYFLGDYIGVRGKGRRNIYPVSIWQSWLTKYYGEVRLREALYFPQITRLISGEGGIWIHVCVSPKFIIFHLEFNLVKIDRYFLTAPFVPGAELGYGTEQDRGSPCIHRAYCLDEKTDRSKVNKVSWVPGKVKYLWCSETSLAMRTSACEPLLSVPVFSCTIG